MDDLSTSSLFTVLVVLLAVSGFFSASETAMMAINRYRLKHQAEKGHRGARLTLALINQTDKLLGVILLGNNLVNTAAATLSTVLAIRLFGEGQITLFIATSTLTFLILVFSEVTPKVIGASFPTRIAYSASFILTPLLKFAHPLVWFVNLFVQGLLKLLRIESRQDDTRNMLGLEELRTVVMESSKLLPRTHQKIMLNLLDLEHVTVDDVMTPRNQIEAIDLNAEPEKLIQRISTSYHTRLLAFDGSLDRVVGILHVRRVLRLLSAGELTATKLKEVLQEPYYVPAGTAFFTQFRQFQENRKRLAIVVDEYGEIQGLVTLEDLLEEIVGEFTTQVPSQMGWLRKMEDGSWLVEGSALVRHINRKLGLNLPQEGPKTLNGLLLERLESIPEAGVSLKIGDIPVEIVQTQGRAVKVARILPVVPD